MSKPIRLSFCLIAATVALMQAAAATVTTRRLHDAVGDYVLTCNAGPIAADYVALTASGVPLRSPYAVAREADKGLVRLMDQSGKRTRRFGIAHHLIRATVRVKVDGVIPDWVDLLFTTTDLVAVRVSISNGGIFTSSDVYRLALGATDGADTASLHDDPDARHMVELGVAAYDARAGHCRP